MSIEDYQCCIHLPNVALQSFSSSLCIETIKLGYPDKRERLRMKAEINVSAFWLMLHGRHYRLVMKVSHGNLFQNYYLL